MNANDQAKVWVAFQELMYEIYARQDDEFDPPAQVIPGETGYPVFSVKTENHRVLFHLEHADARTFEIDVIHGDNQHEKSTISCFCLSASQYIHAIRSLVILVVTALRSQS